MVHELLAVRRHVAHPGDAHGARRGMRRRGTDESDVSNEVSDVLTTRDHLTRLRSVPSPSPPTPPPRRYAAWARDVLASRSPRPVPPLRPPGLPSSPRPRALRGVARFPRHVLLRLGSIGRGRDFSRRRRRRRRGDQRPDRRVQNPRARPLRRGPRGARARRRPISFATPEGADLGASWAWLPDERHVNQAARSLGLSWVPQRLDGGVRMPGGRRAPGGGEHMAPCGPGAVRMEGGYARSPTRREDPPERRRSTRRPRAVHHRRRRRNRPRAPRRCRR